MNYQHQQLAAGDWPKLTFIQQMANIGSEVERAIKWHNKNNFDYSKKAFYRALELIDLSLESSENFTESQLFELTRIREVLVDYFAGDNIYKSSDKLWKNYFYGYTYAARVNNL